MFDCPRGETRSQKKQSLILTVATELFLERGYDAVSLDDILEWVGGSKTTLYSYYGGKEGLFAAIVEKYCQEKLRPLMELEVVDLDPKTGLNAIGRLFLSLISDPKGSCFYRMMIAQAERFPKLAGTFYNAGPAVMHCLLRKNLEHWQKSGSLRGGNSDTLADQFKGLIMGNFHAKSLLGLAPAPSPEEIEYWVTRSVDLFLEGAAPR